jgi:hypothetical protein
LVVSDELEGREPVEVGKLMQARVRHLRVGEVEGFQAVKAPYFLQAAVSHRCAAQV